MIGRKPSEQQQQQQQEVCTLAAPKPVWKVAQDPPSHPCTPAGLDAKSGRRCTPRGRPRQRLPKARRSLEMPPRVLRETPSKVPPERWSHSIAGARVAF